MPSESTKWKGLVTVFKPSEVKVASTGTLPVSTSYDWANKSTLWSPGDVRRDDPTHIRGASVSDLYPWYKAEDLGISFAAPIIDIPDKKLYHIPEESVALGFSIQEIYLRSGPDYIRPPEDTQLGFSIVELQVNQPPAAQRVYDIPITFSPPEIMMLSGVDYTWDGNNVGISFPAPNIEITEA